MRENAVSFKLLEGLMRAFLQVHAGLACILPRVGHVGDEGILSIRHVCNTAP